MKTRRGWLIGVLLAAVWMALGLNQAWATTITVTNADFEAQVIANDTWTNNTVTGWVGTAGAPANTYGVWNPNTSTFFNQTLPSEPNVAFLNPYNNNLSISQTLGETLLGNQEYTLMVYVGKRKTYTTGGLNYKVELIAGSTTLASESTLQPLPGYFTLATLHYASTASDPLIGQTLKIKLSNLGVSGAQQPNFDNVSLSRTAVPAPSTLLLLSSGLVGLIAWRRRAQKKSC